MRLFPLQVDNHEPLAEPGRNGVKVSVKLVADVSESKLHYTEFMWLMSEDLKEVVGMTQKKPQENATHWFVKNVGGKRVVPFAMCNRHGIWRGPAIDAPAANLTGVKPERMHSAKKKLKRQVDKLTLKIEKIESLKRGGKQFDRKKLHENRKSLRAAKKVVQEEKAKAHSEKDRRRQKSNLEELRKRLDFANKAVPGLTKEHYARLGGKRSKMLKKPKCIPEPPAQKAKDAAVDRLPDAKEGGVKDEKGGHEQAMEE